MLTTLLEVTWQRPPSRLIPHTESSLSRYLRTLRHREGFQASVRVIATRGRVALEQTAAIGSRRVV
jgi:hypothetical protein